MPGSRSVGVESRSARAGRFRLGAVALCGGGVSVLLGAGILCLCKVRRCFSLSVSGINICRIFIIEIKCHDVCCSITLLLLSITCQALSNEVYKKRSVDH